MKSSRVTIRDVAVSLDLSTCTVSKILNKAFQRCSYAKKTIERVENRARDMGYVLNQQARSLRTRKTMLVGFLLPSAQVSIFGALTDQIERQLRPHGYQVLIAHSRDNVFAERELLASLLARGVDGLIWIPGQETIDKLTASSLSEVPAVVLDRPGCGGGLPFVATDNRTATKDLAQRMVDLGHRRILALNAPEGDQSMSERLQGLVDVFGAGVREIPIVNDGGQAKMAVMKSLQNRKKLPDALVALSETLALGALAGLRDLNIHIPEDISFAAFDDFPLAAHWSPRLTLIRQDVEKLASAAVETLLQRMAGSSIPLKDVRVPAAMEWRESVAAPLRPREQRARAVQRGIDADFSRFEGLPNAIPEKGDSCAEQSPRPPL